MINLDNILKAVGELGLYELERVEEYINIRKEKIIDDGK